MSKEYGLIVPNKNKLSKPNTILRPSIFDEDSDSDEEHSKPTVFNRALKRQDRVVREKAVEEDPTVFQYDEIYDDMDKKRKESKLARKDIDKKPKYISKLLIAADKRKKENERRIEKQVQKEREAEGEEFKDKESFVTSAYRKKLEELQALEEEEKREEYLESIGDVKKQGNLDGFYRHLYEQKVNYDVTAVVKTEPNEKLSDTEPDKVAKKHERTSDCDDDTINRSKPDLKKRKYRKRDSTNSGSDISDGEVIKKEHLPSNLDADSDFSIDSDSDSESEAKKLKEKDEIKDTAAPKPDDPIAVDSNKEIEEKAVKIEIVKAEIEVKIEKKPKIDIWKKRTVGEVFDAALQRYFERKSLRDSGN